MEMVATAKTKKMTDRVSASRPYGEKIAELVTGLSGLKSVVSSPYLRSAEKVKRVALLIVTADRGLCGGYNSNTLKLARRRIEKYRSENVELDIYIVGKKGAGYFKFLKIPVKKSYTGFDDKFEFSRADEMAQFFMDEFAAERIDRFETVSTVYYNSVRQVPEVLGILPVGKGEAVVASDNEIVDGKTVQEAVLGKPHPEQSAAYVPNTIYEPEPEVILTNLLPLVVKTLVYRSLLEAITSEQIARRVAMKNASDNAAEMSRVLGRHYNRVRQAAITQELSEIVAGADAI